MVVLASRRASMALLASLAVPSRLSTRESTRSTLTVSSDFESGSARVLLIDSATQTVRVTPAGDVARGMPNWWYLRLDGVDTTRELTLEVVARDVVVPGEGAQEGRTISLNPAWTLPTRAAVSSDDSNWSQTAPAVRQGRMATYRVRSRSPRLWLAWGPPFSASSAAAFVAGIARLEPLASPFTLARTREERAVPGIESADGPNAARRPAVPVTGRQHAWETGGSWTPWNTTQGTQDGYREVGRKLGRTVALYLQSYGGR
jgi:hypothetical protein